VKEVWKEITDGLKVKPLVATFISIAVLILLAILLISTLKGKPIETKKTAKRSHIVAPSTHSTQTNFTQ
jgi:hypothetical protein